MKTVILISFDCPKGPHLVELIVFHINSVRLSPKWVFYTTTNLDPIENIVVFEYGMLKDI